ncbi:hypothetical protein [Luteimonas sp. e5]
MDRFAPLLTTALGLAALSLGMGQGSAPVAGVDRNDGIEVVSAQPIRAHAQPLSREQGLEAAEISIAGAVLGMLREQFDDSRVEIRIQTLVLEEVSARDREAEGSGLLKIGDDVDWLPFRYVSLYDTQTGSASWARVTLGAHDRTASRLDENDPLAEELRREAEARLAREFPQQHVALNLADVRLSSTGTRYQRVLAEGSARFDRDQHAAAAVDGLYDPASRRWLRVDCELGAAAMPAP